MAMGYRPVERDQAFLLPPSMLEWLPEDHLVWFVIAAIERLDTSRFHALAKLGGVGRAGYDPDMLLTLLVYAMAHGVRSSRQIERLCGTDVAFRVICAQDVPDHTVLARFRKGHQDALEDLLTQTLVLCAELGMVRLGVVALDGTKIAANASKDANRTEAYLQQVAEQYLADVERADAAEDEQFGEQARGDETPPDTRDRSGRAARIGQALEQISARRAAAARAEAERAEAEQAAGAEYLQKMTDPECRRRGIGAPRKGTDLVAMRAMALERARAGQQAKIDDWNRRNAEAKARGRAGPGGVKPVAVEAHCWVKRARTAWEAAVAQRQAEAAEPAAADGDTTGRGRGAGTKTEGPRRPAQQTDTKTEPDKANMTDPESRLLKSRQGWKQGYNCQTSISTDGYLLTARATTDANDLAQFIPTIDALDNLTQHLSRHTARTDLKIGIALADAGYDTDANLATPGPDRLIADAKRYKMAERARTDPATGDPPADATLREQMTHRLRTAAGQDLYKQRGASIEPSNAWLQDRRGLTQFSRRGQAAAQSELAMACAVTNLLKLTTHGITTAQLRTR